MDSLKSLLKVCKKGVIKLNRAERKRLEREQEKQKNVYVFNEYQYKQKIEELRNELKLDIIQQLWGSMIVSLRDEFGWFSGKYGVKRIHRFIDRFNENMAHIDDGNVALDDFNKWCEDEGISYQVKKMAKGER